MRKIEISTIDAKSKEFGYFIDDFLRYKGYDKSAQDLPYDIVAEIMPAATILFGIKDVPVEEQVEVVFNGEGILRVMRLSEFELSVAIDELAAELDMTADEFLEEHKEELSTAYQSCIRIDPNEEWIHPLSDCVKDKETGEDLVNFYAVFSFLMNALRGLIPNADIEQCSHIIKSAVLIDRPLLNVSFYLEKAIAGYEAYLMILATHFHNGMTKKAKNIHEQKDDPKD